MDNRRCTCELSKKIFLNEKIAACYIVAWHDVSVFTCSVDFPFRIPFLTVTSPNAVLFQWFSTNTDFPRWLQIFGFKTCQQSLSKDSTSIFELFMYNNRGMIPDRLPNSVNSASAKYVLKLCGLKAPKEQLCSTQSSSSLCYHHLSCNKSETKTLDCSVLRLYTHIGTEYQQKCWSWEWHV